jgi:hypothetical protein
MKRSALEQSGRRGRRHAARRAQRSKKSKKSPAILAKKFFRKQSDRKIFSREK